nr:Fanconi anemia group M protein homolog isoform X2 [Ciona intestinalis]|eukprot:XP_018669630.1 Fanconi anemia group M protein homolog isoform X2 [Ciona intestinalis]
MDSFDKSAGNIWIYPTNYPVRDYQLSITKTALFKNTLVVLPTGLGKTFIASVVMYNFYRWFPQGKIIFIAPTKPLVAQQSKACYDIMGIPADDQAEMTGSSMQVKKRQDLWTNKRVFFLTPQLFNNDLASGTCPACDIKCVVFDEAHKAQGNYAYCQVIQKILVHSKNFRVLALSATPGSNMFAVQQVITNLLISTTEIRSEDAIDVRQYTHTRTVEKVVVKLCDRIMMFKEKYLAVIQVLINRLVSNDILYHKDAKNITKYALLMARDQFRKVSGLHKASMCIIEGDFATAISLYHGLELLLQHGMKSFFIFLKGIMDGAKANLRTRNVLSANDQFQEIYQELTDLFSSHNTNTYVQTHKEAYSDLSICYSHPKLRKLEEIVLTYFHNIQQCADTSNKSTETKVIVFCQYRDSVQEVTDLLQQHEPLIRPIKFVGHAPTAKNESPCREGNKSKRFTQKDQLEAVARFCSGVYNTLIATCVGEEGLDIGAVDLIVCFDSHRSPIRLVQRMGRTGRKRNGKIVMLITEGKEERDYNSSVASRKSIGKAMHAGSKSLQYYPHNPPMIPHGIKPVCHKMFITVKKLPSNTKKRKISTDSLNSYFKSTSKESTKSLFLSADEIMEWKRDFYIERDELSHIPKVSSNSACIYLNKEFKKQEIAPKVMVDWLPWQCRLQTTKLVEHSGRTKLLHEMLTRNDSVITMETNDREKPTKQSEPIIISPTLDILPSKDNVRSPHKQNKNFGDIREIFSKVSKINSIKKIADIAKLFTNHIDFPDRFIKSSNYLQNAVTDSKPQIICEKTVRLNHKDFDNGDKFEKFGLGLSKNIPQVSPVLVMEESNSVKTEKIILEEKHQELSTSPVTTHMNCPQTVNTTSAITTSSSCSFNLFLSGTSGGKDCLDTNISNVNGKSLLPLVKNHAHCDSNTTLDSPDIETPDFGFPDIFALDLDPPNELIEDNPAEKKPAVNKSLKRKSDCMVDSSCIIPETQEENIPPNKLDPPCKKLKESLKHIKQMSFHELEQTFDVSADLFDPEFQVDFNLTTLVDCTSFTSSPVVSSAIPKHSVCNTSTERKAAGNITTDKKVLNGENYTRACQNWETTTDICDKMKNKVAEETFEDDESFLSALVKRKQRKAKCLESDESLNETGKAIYITSTDNISDTDSESFFHVKKEQTKFDHPRSVLPMNQSLFENKIQCNKQSTPKLLKFHGKVKPTVMQTKDHAKMFIDNEAEVSGDCDITEDDLSLTDEEMLAFVNDATQLTQHIDPTTEKSPDEKAMYLKSLHSSEWLKCKQNVEPRYRRNIEVFSQEVETDYSNYLEDSFIVEHEDSNPPVDHGEITLLSQLPDYSAAKAKTRNQVKMLNVKKKKKRKLIVDFDS